MSSIDFSYLINVSDACLRQGCWTYIVNTMPPLNTNRPRRGKAPAQKVNNPSSLKIFAAHAKLFLYSFADPSDCMRVLTVSRGIVV